MTETTLPCGRNRTAFDADYLDPSLYRETLKAGHSAEREKDLLAEAVDNTINAVRSCSDCPIFQMCKEDMARQVAQGNAPAGIVQCGIYWGLDHRPDFTLNGTVSKKSADTARERSGDIRYSSYRVDEAGKRWPMTVPVYIGRGRNAPDEADDHEYGPIETDLGSWNLAWMPPMPDPINTTAVDMAVWNAGTDCIITQAKLRKNPQQPLAGKEILTDSDVCEVLRELSKTKTSVRAMAERLDLSHATVKNLLYKLGLPVVESEAHRLAAQRREQARRDAHRRKEHQTPSIWHKMQPGWDQTPRGTQMSLDMELLSA